MTAPAAAKAPVATLDRVANSKRKTLSVSDISVFGEFLQDAEINSVVSRNGAGLQRHGKDALTEDESERAKLVAKVISHAANTFGPDKVKPWLHEPFVRFGHRSPVDLMKDNTGPEQVEEYLVQIDEGYFA